MRRGMLCGHQLVCMLQTYSKHIHKVFFLAHGVPYRFNPGSPSDRFLWHLLPRVLQKAEIPQLCRRRSASQNVIHIMWLAFLTLPDMQ